MDSNALSADVSGSLESTLAAIFARHFECAPQQMAFAPARVNLIGEHVDYNQGIVLPFAIAMRTGVAGGMRNDRRLKVWSEWSGQLVELDDVLSLDATTLPAGWSRYVAGAIAQFARRGHLDCGLDLAIASNVPVGAGLSSSATLTASITTLLMEMTSCQLEGWEAARWCQAAEHEFAGVPCGLMDPLACLLSRAGHLLWIDFFSETTSHIPFCPKEAGLVLVHSGVQHALASGEYAVRRRQCQAAAQQLGLESLRHVDRIRWRRGEWSLSDELNRRVKHVVTEIERVEEAARCCQTGDWPRLGALLTASHRSLANDYGVSCAEVDLLVELLIQQPAVWGARITGGGFGGCVVALMDRRECSRVLETVKPIYERQTRCAMMAWSLDPVDGAWARQSRSEKFP